MNGEELLRCHEVSKVYNPGKPHEVVALSHVTLEVEKGSFTVLTGPSGSGKTTLVSILGTIERPTGGRVYLNHRELTALSDVALSLLRRRRIGLVFQNFNLIPRLPAWDNVSYPLVPEGVRGGERKTRANLLLEKMGLSERAAHPPEEMSGGEQQRVAIARALVNDPDILLLDEPTSNIDSATSRQILDFLGALKAEGKTIVLSTHDGESIPSVDVIYTVTKGRVTPLSARGS